MVHIILTYSSKTGSSSLSQLNNPFFTWMANSLSLGQIHALLENVWREVVYRIQEEKAQLN